MGKRGPKPKPPLCHVCGESDSDKFYKSDKKYCKTCHSERACQWSAAHRDRRTLIHRRYHAKHYVDGDPYLITCRLRKRLQNTVRRGSKSAHTLDLLGCSVEHLLAHLESKLPPGATLAECHIDHIRPCASFDFTDPAQQRLCFHWTNLQPLLPIDNMRKGAKW